MTAFTPPTLLVLHVRKGYEDREAHIRNQLNRRGLPFQFILDGDRDDLSPEVLDRYFTGQMHQPSAATSCAMKHLLACQYIIAHELEGAVVLEDDMILYKNFEKVFAECMEEIESRQLNNVLISFEDSSLNFVPGSQRRRGQHLYPARKDRFAGCIYYSRGAARMILDYVDAHRCDLPIDLLHRALIERIALPYYWCHPTIATQGTHTGLFASSISKKSARRQRYRMWTWHLKLFYKKLIYRFR